MKAGSHERRAVSRAPAPEAVEAVRQAVAHRWQAIDPLLPEPSEPTKICGTDLTVTSAEGRVVAAGLCRHVQSRPGRLELAWAAASQFALTVWVAGPDVGNGLGQLLDRWRSHLIRQQDAAHEDSSAMVRWPSRDVGGVRVLLEHGMRPLTVIAARPADRAIDGRPVRASSADLRIRTAGQGDLDALERLGMEMMRYDAHFGSVTVRAETARSLRESAERTLAAAQPWIWLAERDGEAVGMVQAEPPEAAAWAAPLVRAQPVAYLGEMSVLPGARGLGVGTALVEHLHRELDAAGAAVTLLHHAQLNPLSAPFWNRMGYRPLWTSWEVRPAHRLS
jgi:GNAT superfamily N-acetyltransferase